MGLGASEEVPDIAAEEEPVERIAGVELAGRLAAEEEPVERIAEVELAEEVPGGRGLASLAERAEAEHAAAAAAYVAP